MSEGTVFLVHRNHVSSLCPSCVSSSCLSLSLSASVTANSFCVSNVQTPSKVYTGLSGLVALRNSLPAGEETEVKACHGLLVSCGQVGKTAWHKV